jgi:hypothetical protein
MIGPQRTDHGDISCVAVISAVFTVAFTSSLSYVFLCPIRLLECVVPPWSEESRTDHTIVETDILQPMNQAISSWLLNAIQIILFVTDDQVILSLPFLELVLK